MAEVTRVPIKPVSRHSLLMLALGVLIGLAIAGVAAWWAMPPSVSVTTVTAGKGEHPTADDVLFVKYVGKLKDGTEFDRSPDQAAPIPGIFPEGVPMRLNGMIPGFRDALLKMQRGGKYSVFIPAKEAYGASPPPGAPIPPNADLYFDVELVDFLPLADAQRRAQMMDQMMRQQQEKAGAAAPGAAPAPGASPSAAPSAAPAP